MSASASRQSGRNARLRVAGRSNFSRSPPAGSQPARCLAGGSQLCGRLSTASAPSGSSGNVENAEPRDIISTHKSVPTRSSNAVIMVSGGDGRRSVRAPPTPLFPRRKSMTRSVSAITGPPCGPCLINARAHLLGFGVGQNAFQSTTCPPRPRSGWLVGIQCFGQAARSHARRDAEQSR
jgi:hypothetical protein